MPQIKEEDLLNKPAEKLFIKDVKNAFVTKPQLVLTYKGVNKYCLFSHTPKSKLPKLNLMGFGSLFKHPLKCLPDKNYFFILNLWGTGYHHWLTEVAIKLTFFEEELRKGKILIPNNMPHFIKDTLKLLSFKNIEYFEGNVFIKNLKIISNPNSGHYNQGNIKKLRSGLLERTPIGEKAGFNKIYISRRKAKVRKIINEAKVMEYMERLGFVCMELDEMPLSEQINLFRNCKLFVSIHGAALTNSLFMPEGSKIVELYPGGFDENDYFNACYYRLNSVLGNDHKYFFCEREFPEKSIRPRTDNIVVDVEKLQTFLKETYLGKIK